jgi:hypothetical protein
MLLPTTTGAERMSEGGGGHCVAFAGERRIAAGSRAEVAGAVKNAVDGGEHGPVLVFHETTGRVVDLDLRGTAEDVERRYASESGVDSLAVETTGEVVAQPARGPGRPKLGVVGREVTLLPRHWAWLSAQRGGASVTLRRLVDQGRRESVEADVVRQAQDAAYRFMQATVGDYPGFEEATRALYARDGEGFAAQTEQWPVDLADQARRMAAGAFEARPADPAW